MQPWNIMYKIVHTVWLQFVGKHVYMYKYLEKLKDNKMLCFYFWKIELHYWYFFLILYNFYIIQLRIYSMDRPLLLFPVLCVYIQTNKHSHTQSTYIVEKHKSEIKYSFSFSSQIHLPFATCCSSWSSPFWCSFTQSSVRVLCTQQESKKCTIQETDSPFQEKLYFHPSLPLLLLLFWYFWRLEILIVWLVKCRFSSNSCVYGI